MTDKLILEVTRDGWTKGLQLNIAQVDENDGGWGYRIAGPKFNGSQKTLLQTELTEQDANEIRGYLEAVFPVRNVIIAEALRGLADAAQEGGGAVTVQELHRMADDLDPKETAA